MMTRAWLVVAATLAAGNLAGQQSAPRVCADTLTPGFSEALARKHAPFVWFSPYERYFPTIPFFPAFDNFGGKPTGLGNYSRVAVVVNGQASWDELDRAYAERRQAGSQPPRYVAVFYRIRCLSSSESGTVWTFLRNDPQAWRRSELRRLYDQGLRSANFISVEYYFYYLLDTGLEGHPGDIEKMAVLLPVNPGSDEAQFDWERKPREGLSSQLLDRVRIVIGAGHGFTTPNNVLVVVMEGDKTIPRPNSILVEYGGHSVAPDNWPPDGRFSPGWDINWNLNESVWGTRDAQAVSGSGFLGGYKEWMTLPRLAGNSVLICPDTTHLTTSTADIQVEDSLVISQRKSECSSLIEQRRSASPGEPIREQYPQQRDTTEPPRPVAPDSAAQARAQVDSAKKADDATRAGYLLLPVAPFERLFDLLSKDSAQSGTGADRALNRRIVAVVDNEIRPYLTQLRFGGFDGLGPEQQDSVIHLMRYWTHPMKSRLGDVKMFRTLIWQDFEFRSSPTHFLKRYLYRPTKNSLRSATDVLALLTYNADFYLGRTGGKQFQIGILYPPSGLSPLTIPGIAEAQFGLYGNKAASFGRNRLSFSLVYERHYRRFLSWYVKPFSWVRRRREYESDNTASDVVLGFGASVMPFLPLADKLHSPLRGIATTLRVRTGFRIDMLGFRPNLKRIEAQISLYSR